MIELCDLTVDIFEQAGKNEIDPTAWRGSARKTDGEAPDDRHPETQKS